MLAYVTIERTFDEDDRWHRQSFTQTFPFFGGTIDSIRAEWEALMDRSNAMADAYLDVVISVEPGDYAKERLEAYRLAKIYGGRCCTLAIKRPCVCSISYACPEHGTTCVGSHD